MPTQAPIVPRKRNASRQALRCPPADFVLLTQGRKTEFRNIGRHAPAPLGLLTPSPIVLWTFSEMTDERRAELMVLEDAWSEPLGAISPASIAAEGFEDFAAFRSYWRRRYNGRAAPFKPLSTVFVYRLRTWRDGDADVLGGALLRHLYREFLDA